MHQFLAWRCPLCSEWQGRAFYNVPADHPGFVAKIQSSSLKCVRCGKSTAFYDRRHGGCRVVHKWFMDARELGDYVRLQNELLHRHN